MITICTRWELSQLDPELEWRMWAQLRGAFQFKEFAAVPIVPELVGVNSIRQYNTMEEALESCKGIKLFLEPKGEHCLSTCYIDCPDVTFVLGNTEYGNANLAGDKDYCVRIKTPSPTDFYGINAAAIALAYRYGQ